MSIRGPKLKYFAGVLAIIAIITGIYLTFFHSRGFVKTDAVIVSLEQTKAAQMKMICICRR